MIPDAEKMELNVGAVPVEQFGCFAWFEPGGGGEESSRGVAFGPARFLTFVLGANTSCIISATAEISPTGGSANALKATVASVRSFANLSA